ncbi:DoxX-like family protein [Sphingobacterium faecium]
MRNSSLHTFLTYSIAFVWFANGLYCKVLNLVPRHQKIVSVILGDQYAGVLTLLIGLAEIIMAIWILSGFKSRLNCIFQIIVIAMMNSLELLFVPHLLLWGPWNILYALIFILIIYSNEYYFSKNKGHVRIS